MYKKLIKGQKVRHTFHGEGTFLGYDLEGFSEDNGQGCLVEFDVKPKGWDRVLLVSRGMLKSPHEKPHNYKDGLYGVASEKD